jgi:hypothetical protein
LIGETLKGTLILEQSVKCEIDLSCSGERTMAECYGHGNEALSSIRREKFLGQLTETLVHTEEIFVAVIS